MNKTVFSAGTMIDRSMADENANFDDSISTLIAELEGIGVSEDETRNLACFLYAAWINKVPLLLAGSWGEMIGHTLSVSLFCKKAAVLDCGVPYHPSFLQEAQNSADEIVIMKNVFSSNWISAIIEFTEQTNKYCILLHPFTEDLVIEPDSLFQRFLPVCTDFFVSEHKTPDYIGGVKTEDYEEYEAEPLDRFSDELLSKLGFNHRNGLHIQQLLHDAADLLDGNGLHLKYVYGYLPYAIATEKTILIQRHLEQTKDIDRSLRRTIMQLMGEG